MRRMERWGRRIEWRMLKEYIRVHGSQTSTSALNRMQPIRQDIGQQSRRDFVLLLPANSIRRVAGAPPHQGSVVAGRLDAERRAAPGQDAPGPLHVLPKPS